MPLNTGEVLQNRYRIVKKLGEGGFGAVYRAWDVNLERPRAIKENLDTSNKAQRQFKREAQILDKLVHPNLPRVIDHFIIPGQGQYLVMDFVEGQDLAEMMQNGPLPESRVLPWVIQVCDALSYLHAQNPPVIHRDIKPANIKITPEGKAMLVDFGISKVYDPQLSTTMGARAVTPGYSPPEQYGQGSTDARSDLYALGATLYHLLTGQQPPDSVDIMTHSSPPPPPPMDLNPSLSAGTGQAVTKAMALERKDRWQSAEEFRKAITTQPAQRQTVQVPLQQTQKAAVPAAGQIPGGISRNQLLGGAAALVLVGVLCVAGLLAWLGAGDGNGTPTPVVIVETNTPTAEDIALPTETLLPTGEPVESPTNPPVSTLEPTDTPAPDDPSGTFVDDFGVRMAWIPEGNFMMGSEEGGSDESPVHEVWLDAFAIDVYEVTNQLYAEFLNAEGNQEEGDVTWLDDGDEDARISRSGGEWRPDSGYADHPVVEVSWYGARAYCKWRGARLPTEAEWEKAARGGLEGQQYPWGDQSPVCDEGASNGAQFSSCDDDTVPVGSFSPNGYGLYDMAGNVWEWVADWYASDYYDLRESKNPVGPSSGDYRVLRGGSWLYKPSYLPYSLRVAHRDYLSPDGAVNDYFGFRCARSP
jgi:formylglycine-generating enzyme required for sulfatase activity